MPEPLKIEDRGDIDPVPDVSGKPIPRTWTDWLVLFLREAPTPELEQAIAFFGQKGIAVVRHPKAAGKPLKFDLCGAFNAPAPQDAKK